MADKPVESTEAKEKTPAVEVTAAPQLTPEVKVPAEMERSENDVMHRYLTVDSADVSEDNTFQLAASSECPGEQIARGFHEKWGVAKKGETFIEIMSHEPGDVDLTRMNEPMVAAFTDEHKDERHLGRILKATLSKDKVTRTVVQLDQASKLSKTRTKQIRSGSRPNVSMEYVHTRYLGKRTLEDGRIAHVFAWKGTGLTSTSCPMDPTVGLNRSKPEQCHCFVCGKGMTRSDMKMVDGANYCSQDCIDAETPAEDEAERALIGKMFRSKSKDGTETRISIGDLTIKLQKALDADKRFKVKRDNGDVHSDFQLNDIHQIVGDGESDDWQVLVSSPAWSSKSKLFAVDFTYEDGVVTLGESTEVELKTTLEAVERALPFDAKQFRSVDSTKLADTEIIVPNILTRKIMADKTPEQIAQEAILAKPEIVFDSLETPHVQRKLKDMGYRSKVELEAAANTSKANLTARNTEITALETEFSRDFGSRIAYRSLAGGKKEPVYLRDAIHIAAMEACAHDESKPATEIRQIFRSRVDDLKRDSVAEENIKRAIDAAELGLASRCDDVFSVIKRTLTDSHNKGMQSRSLMPSGAELEYSDEVRNQFKSMPGCAHIADLGGFMSPPKQGRKFDGKMVRGGARRMQRDSLASDFSTVGAMVEPEFRPYIELLRNSTVLDKLGCTYIGGCQGEQVFPRQDAATVAQSVAEGTALNAYDQTLGQIKMTPKRVGSRQYYSRLAVIQAVPGWETMVWNDHAQVLALYMDEMGINGSGAADQPIGILNQPGINQLVFGGTPTYNSILNFRTQIRKFNVPGPLAFCTTSVGQGRLAFLPAALNGSTVITQGELDALWKGDEENGEMLGCKAVASQQIPGDVLLAGVFPNLLMASWGGVFTTLDNYTRADRDEVAITFNTYFDIAVKHAQAFTRSMDSVNQ